MKNNSKAAKDLRELLDNSEIEYRVRSDWKYPNGNCAFQEGKKGNKNKIVNCVSDLVKLEKENALPEILAHELGHAVDFSKRPKALRDRYMYGSETAADLYASSLLYHAGIKERGFSDFMGDDYDERCVKGVNTEIMYTPDGGFRRGNFEKAREFLENSQQKGSRIEEKKGNEFDVVNALRGFAPRAKAPDKSLPKSKANLNGLRYVPSLDKGGR